MRSSNGSEEFEIERSKLGRQGNRMEILRHLLNASTRFWQEALEAQCVSERSSPWVHMCPW